MSWLKTKIKLVYEPSRPGGHKRTDSPWWLIGTVDPGVAIMYRKMLQDYYNPFRQEPCPFNIGPPKWGAHVTVLDGRQVPKNKSAWKKYANKWIEIDYSVEIQRHWRFFVLPVRSQFLEDIRRELGMTGDHNFHITIGRLEEDGNGKYSQRLE